MIIIIIYKKITDERDENLEKGKQSSVVMCPLYILLFASSNYYGLRRKPVLILHLFIKKKLAKKNYSQLFGHFGSAKISPCWSPIWIKGGDVRNIKEQIIVINNIIFNIINI